MPNIPEALSSQYSKLLNIGSTFWIVLILTIFILGGILIFILIKNKKTYVFNVRIFRAREGGKVKESNWVGGYIGRKNLAPFFRIKPKKNSLKHIDFIETPKVEYMDEEDRLYYKQIDVNTFIQLKRIFEKLQKDGKFKFTPEQIEKLKPAEFRQLQREIIFTPDEIIRFTPVESDVKYGAVLSVQRIRDVLRTESTFKKLLPYFALVILAIVFIVAYWMLMDNCKASAPSQSLIPSFAIPSLAKNLNYKSIKKLWKKELK